MADNSSLVSLHAAVLDALNGYEEAMKRAERAGPEGDLSRVQALAREGACRASRGASRPRPRP